MLNLPVDFGPRQFTIWSYEIGHGQLLLRAPKYGIHSTQIDVGFKGVKFIQLPAHFPGLSISEASADALGITLPPPHYTRDSYFLSLKGEGWSGAVVTLNMGIIEEEDAEHWSPTKLFYSERYGSTPDAELSSWLC
jgi:hypothetical protein